MRALNRQFRGKDDVTDVLSFPARPARPASTPFPRRHRHRHGGRGAAGRSERGIRSQTEMRVLALHGLLHLLGYDHDSDDGKMARVEARLRKKAGLREG